MLARLVWLPKKRKTYPSRAIHQKASSTWFIRWQCTLPRWPCMITSSLAKSHRLLVSVPYMSLSRFASSSRGTLLSRTRLSRNSSPSHDLKKKRSLEYPRKCSIWLKISTKPSLDSITWKRHTLWALHNYFDHQLTTILLRLLTVKQACQWNNICAIILRKYTLLSLIF